MLAKDSIGRYRRESIKSDIREGYYIILNLVKVSMPTGSIILKNLDLLDVESGELKSGLQITIADRIIRDVRKKSADRKDAQVIYIGGRVVMPGVIGLHVHIMAPGSWRSSA